MLQLNHIKKEYKTGDLVQKALDDVSLNLRDNEFVAILGPSGSGKTTLLNVIGGLDRYDSGDLIINGISTKKYTDRDWDSYRNHTIGFVFQSYNLIPHQTILSNVELALTISGIGKADRRERARKALEKVGLGEHINKKPNQLSGGQKQRVAIARALVNDPDIVLADEPTGALDSDTSVQIMNLLKDVAKDRLVVMVTHNPELADEYATRTVHLSDGVVVADSDPFDPSAPPQHPDGDKSTAVIAGLGAGAVASPRRQRRTSMSFLTAVALSFNNLMTKKGRTLMTAFAGSIGIIGIALIISLSTGVNAYIADMERSTLSEYPLQILSSGVDITSFLSSGSSDGTVALAEHYGARAQAGLIVAEGAWPEVDGQAYCRQPGIATPAHIQGWRRVTDAVHQRGGRIVLQIMHSGRIGSSHIKPAGVRSVSASAIQAQGKIWTDAAGMQDFDVPQALTTEEVRKAIAEHAAAAQRAMDAGFDGVELHGANGYLIDQFLRQTSNKRTDEYGGTLANRIRFAQEVLNAIAEAIGHERTGIRLSPFITQRGMNDPQVTEAILALAAWCEQRGIAFIHLAEADWDDAPQVPDHFRKSLREVFTGTLIVAGNYDLDKAEKILAAGYADLIAFGRPFIANPDLPHRLEHHLPLARVRDPATLFGGTGTGYTDYPIYNLQENDLQ